MDNTKVPYKVRHEVATFQGDWTAEQIDNGEAGEPTIEVDEQWYDEDHNPIHDPERIAELEESIRQK